MRPEVRKFIAVSKREKSLDSKSKEFDPEINLSNITDDIREKETHPKSIQTQNVRKMSTIDKIKCLLNNQSADKSTRRQERILGPKIGFLNSDSGLNEVLTVLNEGK